MGGDFRQILPLIPGGTRASIINATINSSILWTSCKLFTLTQNMRLQSTTNEEDKQRVKHFSEWLLKLGEGKLGHSCDGYSDIELPENILIKESQNPLHSIVQVTYPNLLNHLMDSKYFTKRVILAPTCWW